MQTVMERRLVLIRHAKSDWETPGQPDFERPLNARGRRDAPVMGRRLLERGFVPDLVLSSPAVRAATTARLVSEAAGYDPARIQWIERLYHCPAHVFDEVILHAAIPDDVQTVFIVAHNPGITHFANDTAPGLHIDNMPTCAAAGIAFTSDRWSDYPSAAHRLLFFDYPKNQ